MKMLYKYPQAAFPFAELVETNRRRSKNEFEYELIDTGVFAEDRYFDVFVEYAKAGPEDILIRISAVNRSSEAAELHLLPTLWFRNTWSWGYDSARPMLRRSDTSGNGYGSQIIAEHASLGRYILACDETPDLLFTENEINVERLYGAPNPSSYVKDGINDAVVHGRGEAVNPEGVGTKAAATAVRTTGRAQQRLAPSQHRRDHLNVRQVGIPLVRRLGPGVPLHPARAARRRVCQGAADHARP
jgi:hypothetical protein